MSKVMFKRKNTDEIKDLSVEDGSLIYNYETSETYMDYGNNRLPINKLPKTEKYENYTDVDTTSYSCDYMNKYNSAFKFKSVTQSATIGANAFTSVDLGKITAPDGYTYLGTIPEDNGYGDQWLVSYSKYGDNLIAMVHSKIATQLTGNLKCKLMFIRTDLISEFII